jgi:hypothetical protein
VIAATEREFTNALFTGIAMGLTFAASLLVIMPLLSEAVLIAFTAFRPFLGAVCRAAPP